MPGRTPLEAPDFRAIFGVLPGLYLLLASDLRVVAASRACLEATAAPEDIVGRNIFDVFPDSPLNEHRGVAALRRSFERVLTSGATDFMALQRYDLRRADASFEVLE